MGRTAIMSTFELAIPTVLRHEGGLVDNPNDPGGITNHGVSLRWLKSKGLAGDINHDGDVDAADIKVMTVDQASVFYRTFWWDAYGYGIIVAQLVATKIFDSAVNLGPMRAHKFAQEIIGVSTDGVLGPKSFAEINATPSLKFITAYQTRLADFYRALVVANPARQEFLSGWLNRAYDRI
jgi:lysozyme family protein